MPLQNPLAANGSAKYWLHGGHLFVNGKKMSKSTGNVYYTSDILDKGFNGEQLRFFLTYGPYRQKLNFTFDRLFETSKKLDLLKKMITDLQQQKSGESSVKVQKLAKSVLPVFEAAMNNDLDVKGAFDNLYEAISELYEKRVFLRVKDEKNLLSDLHKIDSVLQCLF